MSRQSDHNLILDALAAKKQASMTVQETQKTQNLLNGSRSVWKQLGQLPNEFLHGGFGLQLYGYLAQLDFDDIGVCHIGADHHHVNAFTLAEVKYFRYRKRLKLRDNRQALGHRPALIECASLYRQLMACVRE